jgi:carbonic anhydrase
MRVFSLSLILAASLFASSHHSETHWGYDGEVSPKYWGDLKPEYAICSTGAKQSPIDIDTKKSIDLKDVHRLATFHKASSSEVVNNGHTIQVNPEDGGFVRVGDKEYKLLQFHFHSHSEHTIDGKRYDMVAHLVHKAIDGELLVIGVLIQEDSFRNETIRKIWHQMPKEESKKAPLKDIDIASLLPKDSSKYYYYVGSLTTPNCAEGVQWYIMKNPIKLSPRQIQKFRELYSHNFRPINPLNERVVEESR